MIARARETIAMTTMGGRREKREEKGKNKSRADEVEGEGYCI